MSDAAQDQGLKALPMDVLRLHHKWVVLFMANIWYLCLRVTELEFGTYSINVTCPIARLKVSYSRHLDLLTAVGLLAAFQAARRLTRGSCVWLGLPCSSYVWISRGSTRRCRLRPRGAKYLKKVRRANKLVRRICYLFLDCLNHKCDMFSSSVD